MVAENTASTRIKVLIIDDDPMVRDSLDMLFAHYGWEVFTTRTGDDAIAKLPNIDYSLAVVDHLMEGTDGVEIVRYLKERSNAPVFMLTGCIDPVVRYEARRAGADAYFEKPVQAIDLIRAFENIH